MNKVILVGFISQDPTPRVFEEKNTVMSRFSIAVNDIRLPSSSYFFNCVAWGTTAEYINSNLKKGDFVTIDGRLSNRSYTNKDGQKVNTMDITVDSIRNHGSRKPKPLNEELVSTNSYLTQKVNLDEISSDTNTDNNVKNETSKPTQSIDWDDDLE
ncbi:MAG: single-stranded DNA-binding protein [Mycoplasma sp.]